MKKPITAIIVGGGHRSIIYGDYSKDHPDELKVIGIADPDPIRVQQAIERFGIAEEYCFSSAEELAKKGKIADVIINDGFGFLGGGCLGSRFFGSRCLGGGCLRSYCRCGFGCT